MNNGLNPFLCVLDSSSGVRIFVIGVNSYWNTGDVRCIPDNGAWKIWIGETIGTAAIGSVMVFSISNIQSLYGTDS